MKGQIIFVKTDRQTDRLTNFLTPSTGDFFQLNLLPLKSLARRGKKHRKDIKQKKIDVHNKHPDRGNTQLHSDIHRQSPIFSSVTKNIF